MKKSLLIVSCDLPPVSGRAVTGVGLRMHGIREGLRLRGYETKYAISRKRVLQEDGLPEYLQEFAYTKSTLLAQIDRAAPDYILKIWWGEEDSVLKNSPVPVIFDLPAPRLLENIFHNRSSICNWNQKIDSFKEGVFFTCPSLLHKAYYLPVLMMSGFNEKKGLIEVVPHSTVSEPVKSEKRELRFIFGGVFWPWQSPVKGLNTIAGMLEKCGKGTLKVMTGPLPYNDSEARNYFNPTPHLTKSDRLILSPLLPHSEMRAEFSRALVGVDIMERNLERDLSFSFRTLEYLSCGLPVIIGDSGEWGKWIREYKAGWVVDPDNSREIERVVREILLCPDKVSEYAINARNLAKDLFSPEKAIEPLDNFLKTPDHKRPVANSLDHRIKSSELLQDGGFTKEATALLAATNFSTNRAEGLEFQRGLVFMKLGEFDSALDAFKKEECFFPGKAETARMRGVACKERREYAEAVRFFDIAKRADSFLEWVHLEKGLALCCMGETHRAVSEIEEEERLYPHKAETCQARGIVAMRERDYPAALNFFQRAVETDPSLLTAKYNLASLISLTGSKKRAAAMFQQIIDSNHASPALRGGCGFHLGKILLHQKKYEEAESRLIQCLGFSPDHKEAKKTLIAISNRNKKQTPEI